MEADAARLAQQVVEGLNRRDPGPVLAAVHPDFEGRSDFAAMEGGQVFRGPAGAGAWFDNLLEVYDRIGATLEQTVVVGEHALHLVRTEFVGKGSGVALESLVAWVIEARDGRFVFMHTHLNLAEAFHEMGRRLAHASSEA